MARYTVFESRSVSRAYEALRASIISSTLRAERRTQLLLTGLVAAFALSATFIVEKGHDLISLLTPGF